MYSVVLFLLAMPKRKSFFFKKPTNLFKPGFRVFAGWLNSSARVKSECFVLQGLMRTTSSAGASPQRSKAGVGWHWFALVELLIFFLFYMLCGGV